MYQSNPLVIFLISVFYLTLGGCVQPVETNPPSNPPSNPSSNPPSNPGGLNPVPGNQSECITALDCLNQPMISVWSPTCSGNTLEIPMGSGEYQCIANECVIDFTLEEIDCTLLGQVCDTNPDPTVQGDSCVESRSVRDEPDYSPEGQCELLGDLSDTVGCIVWDIDECVAEPDGPQSDSLCDEEFYNLIQCGLENPDGCYCEDDGDLNCDWVFTNAEDFYPEGAPCEYEFQTLNECRRGSNPIEEPDYSPEGQCELLGELSDTVGCVFWDIDECVAEPDGPQSDSLCAEEFHNLIQCGLENPDGCYCEDDGDLNCDWAFTNDGDFYPEGAPCQFAYDLLIECRLY